MRLFSFCLAHRQRRKTAPVDKPAASALKRLDTRGLTFPLEITVGIQSSVRKSHVVRTHVHREAFPEGSIFDIGDGFFVTSPEYCFFQMAHELPLAKLVQLGLELCGSYSLPANDAARAEPKVAEKGFIDRPALTTKASLVLSLARMEGRFDQRSLASALQYIEDGSASPMETILSILLTMPYRYGGYGFPMPELNGLVKPIKLAKQSSSKTSFRCDLYWRELDLAVEYDSDKYHQLPEEIAQDAKKRNSLLAMGITVASVTRIQLRSTVEFERLATQLAIHFDRRLRNNESHGFVKARRELRNMLGV